MNLQADSLPRVAWALEHVESGDIPAATISNDEASARALLRGQVIHLPHQGQFRVVKIQITLVKA